MQTTDYGYKYPDTGDFAKGSNGWYNAYTYNVQRFDAHNHDGANSTLLSASAVSPFTSDIDAGDWVSDTTGYKQVVTVPAGVVDVASYHLSFMFSDGDHEGEIATLGWKKLTNTTFEVYCNDNSSSFTVVYR